MYAVQVTCMEGPEALEVTAQAPTPRLVRDDDVLIRVHAAGVTFPEVLQSRGLYQSKPQLPYVLGSEFAGEVVEAGPSARFVAGDRVVGLNATGAFAEYAVGVNARTLALPDSVSYVDGAGMPMNLITADFALRGRGGLRQGETVLVQGAAGGLGFASVQLASAMGARVIAVVSSEEKGRVARLAGADEVIPVDDFRASVAELTDDRGVDLVVDPVGGDRFTDSLRSLAPGGRLLVLGFTGGEIPTVRVNRLLLNNISVMGVGWGAATRDDPRMVLDQWDHLHPWVAEGRLNPYVDRTLPLRGVGKALRLLEERQVTGKVILTLGEG